MPVADQTPNVQPVDPNDSPLAIADGAVASGTQGLLATGIDEQGYARVILTNMAGVVYVSLSQVVPPTATPVRRFASGTIGGNTTLEDVYTIPNGVTLTIQTFGGGGGAVGNATASSRCTLIERPTGLPASDVLHDVGYVDGNNFESTVGLVFVGNGVRQIVAQRVNDQGVASAMTVRWQGYYL